MSANSYFAEIRRCLFQRGIMGRPATRLVEELEDHFALKVTQAIEIGHDAAAAERLARLALGDPEAVAGSAAENLKDSCWIARHPYVFGLALGFGALVANLFFIVAVESLADYLPDAGLGSWIGAEVLVGLMNWTILVAGGAGLWWLARRYALGWKTLFVACLALTLFVSLIGFFAVASRSVGAGGNGEVSIILDDSSLYLLSQFVEGVRYAPSELVRDFVPTTAADLLFYFHLLAPVGVFFALRYFSPQWRKRESC